MKLITRDTDYALRALIFIARHPKSVVSASELVAQLKIPRPFLRKIMQELQHSGMLFSHKGQGGGFVLARPARRISLSEVMAVFQGPFVLNECLFKKSPCSNRKNCGLRRKILRIERYVRTQLGLIMVSSLLR